MRMIVRYLPLVLLLATSSALSNDGIVGEWVTPGYAARVRISLCQPQSGDSLCGTIVWLWEPLDSAGRPLLDLHDPVPSQRSRPLIGLPLLNDVLMQDDRTSARGRIYNPENGRTYSAVIMLIEPDILKVDGCFLFVCRSQIWRRANTFCDETWRRVK